MTGQGCRGAAPSFFEGTEQVNQTQIAAVLFAAAEAHGWRQVASAALLLSGDYLVTNLRG
jgi:hypothetical protein